MFVYKRREVSFAGAFLMSDATTPFLLGISLYQYETCYIGKSLQCKIMLYYTKLFFFSTFDISDSLAALIQTHSISCFLCVEFRQKKFYRSANPLIKDSNKTRRGSNIFILLLMKMINCQFLYIFFY